MFQIIRGKSISTLLLCLALAFLPASGFMTAAAYSTGSTFFVVTGNGTSGGQTFVCPGGVFSNFFSSDIVFRASSASVPPGKGLGTIQISGNIPEQGSFAIRITISSGHVDKADHRFVLNGKETFVQCGKVMKSGASVVLYGSCGQNTIINFVAQSLKQHGSWFGPVNCS
ncbi:MAG: hypothetical protein OK457_05020 [Thaumarchaeota archaeon]|nr:hypothetical protein [Nitrososphaerota archaeon]